MEMSYIVVKKSERDANGKRNQLIVVYDSSSFEDVYGTWPRVIEPVLDRKHHQHVRLCCPNGEYVNVPISKNKNGAYAILFNHQIFLILIFSALHRLSHHAEPGDLFPVTGEAVDDKIVVNKEERSSPQRRKRRASRT